MKSGSIALLMVLVLVCVGAVVLNVVPAKAQERTVGVGVGDWSKYGEISVSWFSNDSSASVPAELKDLNETEWWLSMVAGVSGANITVQTTEHFKNGTEPTYGGYINIDTGAGENLTLMIISANLEPNDTVYTSGEYSAWKINETITRTYPSGPRETNHINMTIQSMFLNMSANYYWDKSTGVIVETSEEFSAELGGYQTSWSFSFRIIDSNIWVVVPEFPTWTPILIVFIMLTYATVSYQRRSLRTQLH